MPELKDVIAQLVELKVGASDFAKALKESAQSLYQVIFDAGHAVATKENKDKIRDLEHERDTEKTRADGLQTKLTEAEKAQPDLAAVRKQYDDEILKLNNEIKDLKKTGKESVKAARLEAKREALKALLNGVDSDYAEIQVSKQFDRVDFDGEGNLVVMQAGKKIPIQADNPLKALADEIRGATPAKFLSSNADGGSGTEAGGAAGGTSKSFFEGIRKSVTDAEKTDNGGQPRKSAADRLGPAV